MNIEKGKCYRTRSGRKVEVLTTERAVTSHPVVGMDEGGALCVYTVNGRLEIYDNPHDLIAHWTDKPAFDRSTLAKYCNRAIAMDSDGRWWAYYEIPRREDNRWTEISDRVPHFIPSSHAPVFTGDWKDSLLVWEDEE